MTSYIGIDVGKKYLHVYLPIINKSAEFPNSALGFDKISKHILNHYPSSADVIIVFEPTGGYEKGLRDFLKLNQVNFTTIHPNKVRSYAKARGWLAKTDLIDSKTI